MSLRNARPLRFSPHGLSDSLDETDEFPGACAILQNLIPDQTTKNIWTCRPAAVSQTTFGSFTTPTFVSILKAQGSYVYGMVSSGRFAGKDEPFCFDLATGTFVAVGNVQSGNCPTSQGTTGDWTPPTMSQVGVYMVVTHPGFNGSTAFFGWFDLTNPATPIWNAGNLSSTGSIVLLGAITGGGSYVNGIYPNVPLTGGTGTGATADITVAGNVVAAVALRNSGAGYVDADSLSASNTNLGGAGTGFAVVVSVVVSTGAIQFTVVPAWVSQFNGRAYFGINPAVGQPSAVFTDSLTLNATSATQVLTFGDNQPLIAGAGLPLSNELGGIIQSLMVFKATNIYQITGDAATTNLAVNALEVAVGTFSPRSICPTPQGLAFLAPDGLRMIDFDAHVGKPIGIDGTGVNIPFISPLTPSRAAACANAGVLRITVNNSNIVAPTQQEYWYDIVRETWSGPHTFPANCYDIYQNSFVMAPTSAPATLFLSGTTQTPNSSFTENGSPLNWVLQTVMLADNEEMAMSEITEMQVKAASGSGVNTFNISCQDQDSNVYGFTTYNFNVAGSLWGTAIWGQSLWGGNVTGLYPRQIGFPAPVVYNRLAVQISGASGAGFKIGDMFIRQRILGYMQAVP